jgi:hypothetical protein
MMAVIMSGDEREMEMELRYLVVVGGGGSGGGRRKEGGGRRWRWWWRWSLSFFGNSIFGS